MAAKKKTRKNRPKSGQAARAKKTPAKKASKKKPTKKIVLKGQISKKKPASKAARKKVTPKVTGKKSKMKPRKRIREIIEPAETNGFPLKGPTTREGGQSGDLQGLSDLESADSESVVELLEEGNAFEAAAVAGVENADNTEPSEVRTLEVPEDDVPLEYLDRE